MPRTRVSTLSGSIPSEWNTGVFRGILSGEQPWWDSDPPRQQPDSGKHVRAPQQPDGPPVDLDPLSPPEEIPYGALKLAVSQAWHVINQRHNHLFDLVGFEPALAPVRTIEEKKDIYDFQPPGSDQYPPHLNHIPKKDQVSVTTIFNKAALGQTNRVVAGKWNKRTTPDPIDNVKTIDEIIANDRKFRKQGKGVYADTNIGDRDDWFSDDVFAQQQFTGVNPVSITIAPPGSDWVNDFKAAATTQNRKDVLALIDSPDSSLYVADYSYFRSAVGVKPTEQLSSFGIEPLSLDLKPVRYGCSPVGLFNLTKEGRLHPVGIIIDYKGSVGDSVTIFNKCLTPGGNTTLEQKEDWPWRYAKTVLSSGDLLHHQLKVHLTDTHFVEECIIVATHRAFPEDGPIYRLLSPHWERTLSLNKAARDVLVPGVINQIVGVTGDQMYKYIRYVYKNFDFVGGYIPNDLKARGFPLDKLDEPKFHNYAYARNMKGMWQTLRKFVASYLSAFPAYDTDAKVAADPDIKEWCSEIRGSEILEESRGNLGWTRDRGGLASFPEIKKRDELIDALTMCIHIASPQHTAINYLQRYYMSLVINKPPAFSKPLPETLTSLENYQETDVFNALPVSKERAQEYMVASHLPWLLSYKVASEQNLINYAWSLEILSNGKVNEAAKGLREGLDNLQEKFEEHNKQLDDTYLDYSVMDPEVTAVSILI